MSKTRQQLRESVRRDLRAVQKTVALMSGTVTISASSASVAGTNTLFLSEFEVGAEIQVETEIRVIREITSDTALTTTSVFASAHSAKPVYRVNDRVWTDEEINESLDDAVFEIGDQIWRDAPKWLETSFNANLTAGTDVVTLPTTMRSIRLAQVLPAAGQRYVNLREVRVEYKDSNVTNWWWVYGGNNGATKATAVPSAFTIISPTQIELDTYPSLTLTNGLRFYGVLRLTAFASDSAKLSDIITEADSLDQVVEWNAAADLIPRDSKEDTQLATNYLIRADRRLNTIMAAMSRGRSTGPQTVRITSD